MVTDIHSEWKYLRKQNIRKIRRMSHVKDIKKHD